MFSVGINTLFIPWELLLIWGWGGYYFELPFAVFELIPPPKVLVKSLLNSSSLALMKLWLFFKLKELS